MTIIAKGKKIIQRLISILLGYKKTIVTFVTNYLNPSRLIKQILMTFLGIFGLGTIAFIITAKYFSLETLNSYFSLLSSLTTVFAALVAVFVTQDFRKQKRAELLSDLSKERSKTIIWIYEQLQPIATAIEINCTIIDQNSIEFYNFESLSKKLQEINNNGKLQDICVNFTQRFEDIFKLVNEKHQILIQNTNTLLNDYNSLLRDLNDLIKYHEYFLPDRKEKFFVYVKQNKKLFDEIDLNLQELLKLLKNHSLYL